MQAGGVIACPTDTVYGLACHPLSAPGVAKLLQIKQRPWWKGLIIVAHDIELIKPYILYDRDSLKKAQQTWPGPVTWIFPSKSWVPRHLTGRHHGIAVRITQFSVIRDLCHTLGSPLVSTSANLSGHSVVTNRFQLTKQFYKQVDYIVPGKTGNPYQSSQIRHVVSGEMIRA